MKASACRNVDDFRELARRRLPFPVFHYIDGAADDELTKSRNTAAFDDCDLVPSVLEELGVTPHVRQVRMKPGKPMFFGTRGDTLVFGLPGNPVSAFVCFELFVRPPLRVLRPVRPDRHRHQPNRVLASTRTSRFPIPQ